MRTLAVWLGLLGAATNLYAAPHDVPLNFSATGQVQVGFTPWHNVEQMIIDALASARKQVLVQSYLFTSKTIAHALLAAKRRGVDVKVLTDHDALMNGDNSSIPTLAAQGIPVWLEVRYKIAHNKIIIIDGMTAHPAVITGSYNFTRSAQRANAENALILRDNIPLARSYVQNWERHQADALPYDRTK